MWPYPISLFVTSLFCVTQTCLDPLFRAVGKIVRHTWLMPASRCGKNCGSTPLGGGGGGEKEGEGGRGRKGEKEREDRRGDWGFEGIFIIQHTELENSARKRCCVLLFQLLSDEMSKKWLLKGTSSLLITKNCQTFIHIVSYYVLGIDIQLYYHTVFYAFIF